MDEGNWGVFDELGSARVRGTMSIVALARTDRVGKLQLSTEENAAVSEVTKKVQGA